MAISIPQGMDQATVTWTLAHTTGRESLAGARGFVRFEPTATAVALPSMTVLPRPVEARVVAGVMEPVELMVNDPELWNWRVIPEVGVAWAAFHVDVLGPVDLATVAVVPGKGPVRAVTGPPGRGLNLLGEKPSVADLPAGATEGDAWLVGPDLHVWGGGRWVNAGPIRGPQGVEGERGRQGERGEKGKDGERGEPGETGLQGIPGPANHLTIGSVSTGEVADATLTGETPNQSLNLVIPTVGYVPEYDSGERDITSLIPDVTSGSLHLWRIGRTVWLDFRDLIVADQGTPGWITLAEILPVGFRNTRSFQYVPLAPESSADAKGPARLRTNGDVLVYGMPGGKRARGIVSFLTRETPPASPPGTAA